VTRNAILETRRNSVAKSRLFTVSPRSAGSFAETPGGIDINNVTAPEIEGEEQGTAGLQK